jgi:hypothetical protein
MIKLFENYNKEFNIIIDINNLFETEKLYLIDKIKEYNGKDSNDHGIDRILKDKNIWGLFLTINNDHIFVSFITVRDWGAGYDKITFNDFFYLENFNNLLKYLENKKKTKKYNI